MPVLQKYLNVLGELNPPDVAIVLAIFELQPGKGYTRFNELYRHLLVPPENPIIRTAFALSKRLKVLKNRGLIERPLIHDRRDYEAIKLSEIGEKEQNC